jgi:hypothetical protein
MWSVEVPFWLLATLFVAPTVLAWRSELRHRRRERGHLCIKCGYDLAGLAEGAEGGVCPECGMQRKASKE